MRQSIDDVDVLNLLQAAGGGARVSGAVLGLLVEGGNQPGAPEGGEMLGQHSAQSAPVLGQNPPCTHCTTRSSENSYCVSSRLSSRDGSCHKRDPAVSESSSEMLKIQFWNVSLLTRFFVG